MHIIADLARILLSSRSSEGILQRYCLSGGAHAALQLIQQARTRIVKHEFAEYFTTFSGFLRHTFFGVFHGLMWNLVGRFSAVLAAFLEHS